MEAFIGLELIDWLIECLSALITSNRFGLFSIKSDKNVNNLTLNHMEYINW